MLGAEVTVEHERQLARMVLHAMSFINNHVLPANLPQNALLLQDVVVSRQQHVKLPASNLVLQFLSRVFVAFVDDLDYMRRPFIDLHVPVGNSSARKCLDFSSIISNRFFTPTNEKRHILFKNTYFKYSKQWEWKNFSFCEFIPFKNHWIGSLSSPHLRSNAKTKFDYFRRATNTWFVQKK